MTQSEALHFFAITLSSVSFQNILIGSYTAYANSLTPPRVCPSVNHYAVSLLQIYWPISETNSSFKRNASVWIHVYGAHVFVMPSFANINLRLCQFLNRKPRELCMFEFISAESYQKTYFSIMVVLSGILSVKLKSWSRHHVVTTH